MVKNLVIVESPAKAKTIEKFLGKDFVVKASMGHVRDLPKSQMGIDTEKDFEPKYGVAKDKLKVVRELKDKLGGDTVLWLATDEDREGESIAWHLLQALKIKDEDKVKRIVFHEITKEAIQKAVKNPRKIDQSLVNAQQARRVLDRLVGYELSPLLWKKIRYGLSAGRVQSSAVRLVVEREREIKAFKVDEFWKVIGQFQPEEGQEGDIFAALLTKKGDKKLKLENEKETKQVLKELEGASYKVKSVEEKEVKRNPAPPFTTSTLQQEAARKLRFSVKKTMVVAQQLYEGVDVGTGRVGLITYMRTDSVNLAASALNEAKEVVLDKYGKEYALEKPRFYKSKKGAQEAHEAIRPTLLSRAPMEMKQYLEKDQYALYRLIWQRTLACQMAEARIDKVKVAVAAEVIDSRSGSRSTLPVENDRYVFEAVGETVAFDGFMKVYVEGVDQVKDEEEGEDEGKIPRLKAEQALDLKKLESKQCFTKPPARYTEASLVKKLEAEGIGRPSTYAPTISTIMMRGYVEKEERCLKPTDTAEVVTDVLVEHFSQVVDLKFTARMEEALDEIAEGKKEWTPVVREFYEPFHDNVQEKDKTLEKKDIVNEKTDKICEKCGAKMVIKLGKYGKFLSCSNYPECKHAQPLEGEKKDEAAKELARKLTGKKCDKCGKPMEVKKGKYGEFLGCSGYPDCKNIKPLVKFMGVKCTKCETGQLVERRTRKGGRIFYGCNKFPKCKMATWDKPLKEPCKKCGGLMVEKKDVQKCVECG